MTSTKLAFVSLFTLLLLTPALFAQIGETQQPAEQYRRYAGGSVRDSANTNSYKLYLTTYYYKDVPGKSGFLGLWGNRAGILVSAVDLTVNPGYQAEVCGTFAGTKRSFCLPKVAGNNSLKEFSNISSIRMTKVRKNDEIVMWYGLRSLPVAIPAPENKPPGFKFFSSPFALWIPNGYWVRLCTEERQTSSTCTTYTKDASNIKGIHEYIYTGKGSPPQFKLVVKSPDIKKLPGGVKPRY